MNSKITEQHRSRPAYIYVRQSTNAQVLHHQESTERQYALREMALEKLFCSRRSVSSSA